MTTALAERVLEGEFVDGEPAGGRVTEPQPAYAGDNKGVLTDSGMPQRHPSSGAELHPGADRATFLIVIRRRPCG